MIQRFLLPLLVTSAIVASPVMADELPNLKKPGFRGCGTYLIKDNEAIAKSMPEILFCIQKQMDAFAEGKKIPDGNFVEELKKGKVSKVLKEDYTDADGLANYLGGLEELTGEASGKAKRDAIRTKVKAKATIESSKADLKNADKKAMAAMLGRIQEDQDSLIAESGIESKMPKSRNKYGSRDVIKLAKAPFGPVLFREAKANEYKIENLGYMKAAIDKLMKNPKDIPSNPKFILAAATAMNKFWATSASYDKFDKNGFDLVKDLVRNTSIVVGALKSYQDDLSGAKDAANEKLQAAKRTKADAKNTIKGGDSFEGGEDGDGSDAGDDSTDGSNDQKKSLDDDSSDEDLIKG